MHTGLGVLLAFLFTFAGTTLANAQLGAPMDYLEYVRVSTGGWEASKEASDWFKGRAPSENAVSVRRMSSVLQRLQPETGLRTRGAREVSLYQVTSPSVVLVLTNDGFGSGSLIRQDGTILTNWHVVGGNAEVAVIFKPMTEGGNITRSDVQRAQVLKIDQVADLALVRVSSVPQGALPLSLGSLAEISVGSDVHAIGHPTGETWTYTKGLVSQIRKGYEWTSSDDKVSHEADVIQTQTPINPGNSGGPLLSDAGRLVGVNSFRKSGEGLNFAVAVSEVEAFLNRSTSRLASRAQPAPSPTPTPATCTPVFGKQTRSKNNNSMMRAVDVDCDGTVDGTLVVPDDPTKAILLVGDENHDGKPDVLFMDRDRDGKWEESYYDTDYDGKWDLVGHHPDGNLEKARYEPYRG